MSTKFEERSRFRLSVMWVLLLSGAACLCARDGASRTLLLVSVEVSEARPSMLAIDVVRAALHVCSAPECGAFGKGTTWTARYNRTVYNEAELYKVGRPLGLL